MTDLPERLFANPVWHALNTTHSRFAISAGEACRYPADMAPFAAIAGASSAAMRQLHSLLSKDESVWLVEGRFPPAPGLYVEERLGCLQMVLPRRAAFPAPVAGILELEENDAADMVALTALAFPGFFRARTYEMGSYYGVRSRGKLIAMGGERMMLDGFSEISGVCTHPAHRSNGHASNLLWRLARKHRLDGHVSWLHVVTSNRPAIDLYIRMGFIPVRELTYCRISRTD